MADRLKVLAYPADVQGCGTHRVLWPVGYAAAAGAIEVILGRAPVAAKQSGEPIPFLVAAETKHIHPDVVVLQRPLEAWMLAYLLRCEEMGIATVVEIDDDFTNLNPQNPAYAATSPLRNGLMNRDWLLRCCEAADLVTVSTPSLAAIYGKHGRVRVVRNRVPGRWLTIERQEEPTPTLLWTGVYRYHHGDLDVAKDAIRTQLPAAGWGMRTIGGSTELEGILRVPVEIVPWVALHEGFPESIAVSTAGIVPLVDRPFNRAKSYIKGLEYAALGLPFIASATPEYVELANRGCGVLADSPGQWRRRMRTLVESADWRAEQSARNRAVAATLTHEEGVEEWVSAWRQAVEHRMSMRVAV